METPLVSVCCITYNQELYIRQTLDGIIKQITDFKFEIVISNDCSTDNTQGVIDEYKMVYPDLFVDVSPSCNLGICANFKHVIKKSRGKYIAFCEGDDYWLDSYKLQKQVDILERNKSVSLVYSDFCLINSNGMEENSPILVKWYNDKKRHFRSGNLFYSLLVNNYILTCTVCVRRKNVEELMKSPSAIDYTMFLISQIAGDAIYIPQKLAAYRKSISGVSVSSRNFIEKNVNDSWWYAVTLFSKNNTFSFRNKTIIYFYITRKIVANSIKYKRLDYISDILSVDKKYIFYLIPAVMWHYLIKKVQV